MYRSGIGTQVGPTDGVVEEVLGSRRSGRELVETGCGRVLSATGGASPTVSGLVEDGGGRGDVWGTGPLRTDGSCPVLAPGTRRRS